MFQCGNCGKSTEARQPINYVTTDRRPQTYENFVKRRNSEQGDWVASKGSEIVKEIKACPPCFASLTGLEPKIAEVRAVAPPPEKKERPQFKPRRDFNNPKKPVVDKTNPNWKYKQELDEIKRREAKSPDPRGDVQRKAPVVEVLNRIKRK